jgi:hypothetical protein
LILASADLWKRIEVEKWFDPAFQEFIDRELAKKYQMPSSLFCCCCGLVLFVFIYKGTHVVMGNITKLLLKGFWYYTI